MVSQPDAGGWRDGFQQCVRGEQQLAPARQEGIRENHEENGVSAGGGNASDSPIFNKIES
jgi:hypothetical protein